MAYAEKCPVCGERLVSAAWSPASKDVYACVECGKEWLVELFEVGDGDPTEETYDELLHQVVADAFQCGWLARDAR